MNFDSREEWISGEKLYKTTNFSHSENLSLRMDIFIYDVRGGINTER